MVEKNLKSSTKVIYRALRRVDRAHRRSRSLARARDGGPLHQRACVVGDLQSIVGRNRGDRVAVGVDRFLPPPHAIENDTELIVRARSSGIRGARTRGDDGAELLD